MERIMPEAVRRSRWIQAPLILVGVLAVGWTALWFYAARQADSLIAAWVEREAQVGRVYACATRSIGGYPFRIELHCAAPSLELRGGTVPVVLKARDLHAVTQVYQPGLVIAEVTGPMTIAAGGDPAVVADWTLMQLSVRGLPAAPERISLSLDGAKLDRGGDPLVRARHLEFHVRVHPGSGADNPVYDLVTRLTGATVPPIPALAARPVDAEIAAVLRGLKDLRPKPMPVRLREWHEAGGRLEITNARIQQGDVVAVAKGDFGLKANGRLDGAANVTIAGFAQIAGLLFGGGASAQSGLLAGLALLGAQTELEGKRALSVPLRITDGAVFFGPVPLGQVPPLF
jgi:hypothetical protein